MTARQIRLDTARAAGVDPDLLAAKCSTPTVVAARNQAMARCRDELGMCFAEIGRMFGKDHTTVMHGIKKYRCGAAAGDSVARLRAALVAQSQIVAEQARTIERMARQIEALGRDLPRQRELFAVKKRRSA